MTCTKGFIDTPHSKPTFVVAHGAFFNMAAEQMTQSWTCPGFCMTACSRNSLLIVDFLSRHSQDAQTRVLKYFKRNEMLHEMGQKGPSSGHRAVFGLATGDPTATKLLQEMHDAGWDIWMSSLSH